VEIDGEGEGLMPFVWRRMGVGEVVGSVLEGCKGVGWTVDGFSSGFPFEMSRPFTFAVGKGSCVVPFVTFSSTPSAFFSFFFRFLM
jgi:hypothetical protein